MSEVTPWRTGTDRRRAPRVVDASLVERRDADGDEDEDEEERERYAWSGIRRRVAIAARTLATRGACRCAETQ